MSKGKSPKKEYKKPKKKSKPWAKEKKK